MVEREISNVLNKNGFSLGIFERQTYHITTDICLSPIYFNLLVRSKIPGQKWNAKNKTKTILSK